MFLIFLLNSIGSAIFTIHSYLEGKFDWFWFFILIVNIIGLIKVYYYRIERDVTK